MNVKDNAWRRVVKHFNNESIIPNIQVAKIEWKKLRDNHRDALKRAKLGKNKLLPAHITTWKYAKIMQFLEPHMKYRITENIEMENIQPGCSTKKTDQCFTTDAEDDIKPVCSKKRRHIENTNETPQNSDALESFYNCILKSTKVMPPWMQTQVKKKIFAIIIEAEETLAEQHSDATNNPSQDTTDMTTEQSDIEENTEPKIKIEVCSDDV
ncbi:PREDICTED: uncharacterized protein LOC106111114 isoform X2 [Papilio polytes]|nr:PREDICTED: uncharacterized protein LOC106111114 isoform X2 [Papilio polytes]